MNEIVIVSFMFLPRRRSTLAWHSEWESHSNSVLLATQGVVRGSGGCGATATGSMDMDENLYAECSSGAGINKSHFKVT